MEIEHVIQGKVARSVLNRVEGTDENIWRKQVDKL